MTQAELKPIPVPDSDSKPYWEAANRGVFSFQRCRDCGRAQFYSRSLCSHCQSKNLNWESSKGTGKVASFSVVYRAPTAPFAGDVPYVVALIDMDEGFRFMCNVLNCDPASVTIGMPVRALFEERPGSPQKIPQVEPLK